MSPEGMDIFHMIGSASFMVQFVLLLLLFFSVTSWAIILIKFFYLRKAFKESDDFTEIFWESRDLSVAYKEAKNMDGSPLARVFSIGYMELKKHRQNEPGTAQTGNYSLEDRFSGINNVQRSLRRAINTEVTRMAQMVPFLATAGNTTPFIGLFGTVWGIMESFHGIGTTGSVSLAVVVPGISGALVTTAAGLAVAIPSVIFFNYFMQRIRIMETELHSFSADFLNIIESDIIPNRGGR